MSIQLDGNCGLLENYDYQTPSSGFSYTFPARINTVLFNPSNALDSGTVTMPANPVDGMKVAIRSSKSITVLTINGNTGQSVSGSISSLSANGKIEYIYRIANTTWYLSKATMNYDVSFFYGAIPPINTTIMAHQPASNIFFPANLTGSLASVQVAPSGNSQIINIYKNAGLVGNITFPTAGNATFNAASSFSISTSDQLIFQSGSTLTNASGLSITLHGVVGA